MTITFVDIFLLGYMFYLLFKLATLDNNFKYELARIENRVDRITKKLQLKPLEPKE